MNKGILYLVSTPIGNLGDITYRAVEILKSADMIAAEDTRHTLKLLNSLDIHTKLVSFHEYSSREKAERLIAQLEDGKNIALVTDAGTPIISDPGAPLVNMAAECGITVTAAPGACAAITALTLSGMNAERFLFEGFLPRDHTRVERLKHLAEYDCTFILYESPHQLKKTLSELSEILGDRPIAICKELTKFHETIDRTTLFSAVERYTGEIRGEYVLVLAGKARKQKELTDADVLEILRIHLEAGESRKNAVKATAEELNISKNRVYQLMLAETQKD